MENTLHLFNHDKILVAAHRGVSGANIPCNTIPAFDIAVRSGAAILEMDLFQSKDGEIFVFHTGKEPFQLDRHVDLTRMEAAEIRKLRLVNVDFFETEWGINSFDEVLEHFKGRCILNLDRCGGFIPDVVKQVERHNMREQILLKNSPIPSVLQAVEEVASKYMFMPIYMEDDTATDLLTSMNVNFVGAELVFKAESSAVIQPEYIESMKKRGLALWGNAVLYNYKVPLSAGHTDDVSMMGRPEDGWGWLADRGFDIIQSDWADQCYKYLHGQHSNRC